VERRGPHDEARGAGARAVLQGRVGRRARHCRVRGESEIIVRAELDEGTSVDDHPRAYSPVEGTHVPVETAPGAVLEARLQQVVE